MKPTVLLVVALLVVPAAAAAQKDPFVDALVDFHSKLAGTYGDEGPAVAAALDRMAASLARWSRATVTPAASPGDLALLHLEHGRLDAALTALEAASRAEPGRAAFHLLRGMIHQYAGRAADAEAAFLAAFEIDPAPAQAYLLADSLATRAAADLERPVAALIEAQRTGSRAPPRFTELALVNDRAAATPIFAPALYADGFAAIARHDYEDAVARFRSSSARDRLISDSASASDEGRQGIAALRERRGTDAVAFLERAVAAAPSRSEARRALAAALTALGSYPQAIEHLRQAIRLAPDDERSRVALGRTLLAAGRARDAEQALRDTLTALPASAEARWALADVYEASARPLDALRELEVAATSTVLAGKGSLYWRIAQIAYQHQDYDRVVAVLGHRARLMPNEPHAHKDLGLAYLRLGRQDEALAELVAASLLGLDDAEALAALGQIHLGAGRYDLAESTLRRAVAVDPELPQARYALGTTLLRLEKRQEGEAQLAEFRRLRTAALDTQRRTFEITTLVHEADTHVAAGRLTEAAGLLEKAGALGGSPEIYRQLAEIYGKLNRPADRRRALETFEKRQP